MSAPKTPFEIRLELLNLARDILTVPVYGKRESAMQEYHSSRETFPGETEPRDPKPFPTLPEFPTSEQILTEAKKLKVFVDG